MKRHALLFLVAVVVVGARPQSTWGNDAALTSIPEVRETLRPLAQFLSHAYDLRAEDSPGWRILRVVRDERLKGELREFLAAFAALSANDQFADFNEGLHRVVRSYEQSPSLMVFGPPSYSYVMANEGFDTAAESTGTALAFATGEWAVANTGVVEHNLKEVLGGLAAIVETGPQSAEGRIKEALAERRRLLNQIGRQTEAFLTKYRRLATAFEKTLYAWDESSPAAMGAIVNPVLIEALTASKARLGRRPADQEKARRIEAAIQMIRRNGVRFEQTSATGANEPGPGIVNSGGEGFGAGVDSGLYQQLARTAYLYMDVVWSGNLARSLDVDHFDLKAASGALHRLNVDLADQIMAFQDRFLDEIQTAPRKPLIEISEISWDDNEILRIVNLSSPESDALSVGQSFKIIGEIPDPEGDELERKIKVEFEDGREGKIDIRLRRTAGTTAEGISIFESKPIELVPAAKEVAENGFFHYPEGVPLPPKDPIELRGWMETYLEDVIVKLIELIEAMQGQRNALPEQQLKQRFTLSVIIALYVEKLQSLTQDLVRVREDLLEQFRRDFPSERDRPPEFQGVENAFQEARNKDQRAKKFKQDEGEIWVKELAWKEYFGNFDKVINETHWTVLKVMKWMWWDIAVKRRIKPPPQPNFGPGLRPYPTFADPPRFLMIPRLPW